MKGLNGKSINRNENIHWEVFQKRDALRQRKYLLLLFHKCNPPSSAKFRFSVGSNLNLFAGRRLWLHLSLHILLTILGLVNFSNVFLCFSVPIVTSGTKYWYLVPAGLSHLVAQESNKVQNRRMQGWCFIRTEEIPNIVHLNTSTAGS